MRAFTLAAALAATTAAASADRPESPLAKELAGRVAGPSRSCVSPSQGSSVAAIGEGALAYRSGATLWINRPGGGCPGLRPDSILIVEAHGNEYCRGDHVRGFERGSNIPGPICILGDWAPWRRGN